MWIFSHQIVIISKSEMSQLKPNSRTILKEKNSSLYIRKDIFLGLVVTIGIAIAFSLIFLNNTKLPDGNSKQLSPHHSPKWKIYKSGEQVENYDFSITYPQGWKFKLQKDQSEYFIKEGLTRIWFDISPPEWKIENGLESQYEWGSFAVDVYPHSPTITSWISTFLPGYENRLKIESKKIGNKAAYLLIGKSNPDKNIDLSHFYSRTVVLGEKYSYVIGFGNAGWEIGSEEIIEKEIFPGLKFGINDN